MTWFHLINVFFAWLSWHVASTCKAWSAIWWFNMFASSLNAVVVVRAITS